MLNITSGSDLSQFGSAVKTYDNETATLKRQISATEQKLNLLDAKSAEYQKLQSKLETYKVKLENLEKSDETEQDGLSDSERKRKFDSLDNGECQTCKNRRYVDVSNDSSVSFQTPTRVAPAAAGAAVRAHENQHVAHNQEAADRNGQKVVYQTVTIKTAICPECGKTYVAGGVTKTVTKTDNSKKFDVGKTDNNEKDNGTLLDEAV